MRQRRALEDGVAVSDILDSARFIREALQYEFTGVQEADLESALESMLDSGVLCPSHESVGTSGAAAVRVAPGSARLFSFLHGLVEPFVRCHAFVAATLPQVCTEGTAVKTDKQLTVALMSKAREAGEQLFTADTIANALRYLNNTNQFSTKEPST
eukprot:SAG31_NODE_12497_length_937_cov_0.861575_1_plen_155_part_01